MGLPFLKSFFGRRSIRPVFHGFDAIRVEFCGLAANLGIARRLWATRRSKRLVLTSNTHAPWLVRLMERRLTKIAAVALANKIARMAWAMMARDEKYWTPLPQAV